MKKLLALLVCLAFCLPLMAYAEAASTLEQYTVDCGDFTIDLFADDLYSIAQEKTDSAAYAIICPAYDETSATHDFILVIWFDIDFPSFIAECGLEHYADTALQEFKDQFARFGAKTTDEQVLRAVMEDDVCEILIYANMDFTGAGNDLVTPMYNLQIFTYDAEYGTYLFTCELFSMDALEAMYSYLDSVTFK